MKYNVVIILFFTMLVFSKTVYPESIGKDHNILIIHSYNPGLDWTSSINDAILQTLSENFDNYAIVSEYLDSKRLFDEKYELLLYSLFSHKYKNTSFDIIIVSDDDALRFLMNFGEELFPRVPVVFSGINDYHPGLMSSFPRFTGVLEIVDIYKTLEVGIDLFPKTKYVYVIGDNSSTAYVLTRFFQTNIQHQFDIIDFIYINEAVIEKTLPIISSAPENSLILLLPYVSLESGKIMEFEDSAQYISENSNVPVLGLWDFTLGQGVLGGKLVSGYQQGKMAALIAAEILHGKDPEDIPIIENSQNQFYFDNKVLKRFHIDITNLPAESIIINMPPNFIEKYREYIPAFLIGSGMFLILFIVYLVYSKSLRKMLQNKILFQQNLINTLPNPVFYTNKNGIIEGCNNAFQKLTGKSKENLIGKKLPGIIPPDQLEFHKKENENVLKFRSPRISEGRIIGENDKLLDVIFYKSPLSLGKVDDIGLIETIVDITEKKKSDDKIRQSEERYALATLATRDGIWDWNLENEKLYIAPRFAEILGINSNDDDFGFDSEKLENHIFTGDLQLFLYQVQLIKERIKESFDIEMRMVRTDGKIIWANLKVFGICNNNDEVARLVGSLSDIQERKDAEIQMRKWEEIFMNTQMGIAILNPENLTIELLNPKLAHIHDYEQFELKDKKLDILISTEFKGILKESIEISDNNGHHLLEAVNTKKDGSSFPALININTVKDKKNRPVYIIINIQDISIRKAHEREIDRMLHYEQSMNEELRSNEEELKQMLEQTVKLKEKVEQSQLQYIHFLDGTTDFAILKDNELNFLHVNKSFADYFENDPEYFIGKNDFDILPHETAGQIKEQDKQVLKRKTMILFENEYNDQYFETRRFPVYYEKGKIGLGVFVRDITRQKLIEQQLQKNELRFKTLLENAFDAIMLVDEKGIINYCTDVIETITGIKAKDLIGTSMSLIVHKDDRQLFNENLKMVVDVPGHSEIIRYKSVNSNDQPRFIESFAKNHLENKLINGILITSRDISIEHQTMELKKSIELAKRSAEMKQQFLSNMSHEIRTPMNGIVGMIEFLIKTNLDDKQKDYVETIRDSADSLLNIINDILDFSKIEAGKMTINPNLVSIRKFASNTGKLFLALAKQKEIGFLIKIDDSIPDKVLLDSVRLNQVVSNLVSNAVKFTPEGEVVLNFKNEGITGERINLLIEVRDTGIGIDSEDQKKLFSSFSQIDSSLTRTMEGTGLGLAISQKIVELMGGELKVESIQGKGSRFWFIIQPKIVTDIITESDQDKNINFKQEKLDLNILLVEDKLVNQKVIKLMLNSMGCNVTIAGNGQDAINLIRKNRRKNKDIIPVFDIIIMDIQMPVMDGITATKLIRQNFPEYKTIIGMSANAITTEINSFIESGLDDYIIKPAKSHEIYQKLLKWKQNARIR